MNAQQRLLPLSTDPVNSADQKIGTPKERAAKAAAAGTVATVITVPHKARACQAELERAKSRPRWPRNNTAAHAALRRAAQVVTALKETSATFDERRAALLLENLCLFNPDNGDDPKFRQIFEWVSDHGQSLDWIFEGDPRSMICTSAAFTSGEARRPKLVIVTTPDPPSPGAA
jgi:hypothetical protein